MTFPSGKVPSSTPVPSQHLSPDGRARVLTVDYEYGGSTLGASSGNMRQTIWKLWVIGNDVRLAPESNQGAYVTLFSGPGISEVSLTFDQNMSPFVAFVQNGVMKLYWQDLTIPAFVTEQYGTDNTSPFLTFDDKRPAFLGLSDVIMFYLRGTKVYARLLRDRFTVEYDWATIPSGTSRITAASMTTGNRLQLSFEEPFDGIILPPVFTSYDGEQVIRLTVLSGTTQFGYSTAVDASTPVRPITYSMGGPDAGLISHNATSDHALSFTPPCDYYNPTDADKNNEYVFYVNADNGVYTVKQTFYVTVVVTEQSNTPEVEVKKRRKPIFLDANSDFRLNLLGVLVYDEDAIQNKLSNFLRTRKGTRFRQPDFGCALPEFIHEMCNESTASLIRLDLIQGISKWMPEIRLIPGQSTVTVNDAYSGYEIVLYYYIPALDKTSSVSFEASKY